ATAWFIPPFHSTAAPSELEVHLDCHVLFGAICCTAAGSEYGACAVIRPTFSTAKKRGGGAVLPPARSVLFPGHMPSPVWLGVFTLAVVAGVFLSARHADAQAGGYDPRTWSYDPARNVLIEPDAPPQRRAYASPHEWSPIPREVVAFAEA